MQLQMTWSDDLVTVVIAALLPAEAYPLVIVEAVLIQFFSA